MIKCFLFFSILSLSLLESGEFQVVKGVAKAEKSGSALTIHNSDGAILYWDNFSIGYGESIHFAQDHRASLAINKVIGDKLSRIEGILSSNGKVALINPHGIHFTATALVDTAAFIASTANLSLDGETFCFDRLGDGKILQEGTIRSNRDVMLIARHIDHSGITEGAEVYLLSADHILIQPHGKKRIAIQNTHWEGEGATYATAISHRGSLHAHHLQEEQGRIFLVSSQTKVDGKLIAPSGEIHVLGREVLLAENAEIDASGPMPGSIFIGGEGSESTNALSGSVVRASNTGNGDGGTVIYWADGITHVASHTEACGGPQGGNGGFIEISGKKTFFYRGTVDRSALCGEPGLLFFDPEADINISAAPVSNIGTISPFIPTDTPANIDIADLVAALNTGNVLITTNGPTVPGPGGMGDLTLSDPLSWSSPYSLTCLVGHDATLSATITNTGTGGVQISAQRAINVKADITLSGGNIQLAGGLGFPSDTFNGISTNASLVTSGSGTIQLTGTSGGGGGMGCAIAGSYAYSTQDGNITILGHAPTLAAPFSEGIVIEHPITTANGAISITGISSSSNGETCNGIEFSNGFVSSTGTGSVTITGVCNGGNGGITFAQGTFCQTNTGPIEITGTAVQNVGIYVDSNPKLAISNSGAITINAEGRISLQINFPALISTTGPIDLIANGDAFLFNGAHFSPSGSHRFTGTILGDLTLEASMTDSTQIGSSLFNASAPIQLNVSQALVLNGSDPNYAAIGHGTPSLGLSVLSGDITISANEIVLTSDGTSGFTQIGHINSAAGSSTIDGNLTVTAQQSVQLIGATSAYARIGHGGQAGATTYLPATTQVFAGTNIALVSADIAGPGGSLTLVVDNAYPDFPSFGSGSIQLDANSTLSSASALRIYTSDQSLNTLDGTLNGALFTPGPFNVNSATEEWQTYYPNGSYANTLFKLYYKVPILHPIAHFITDNHVANLTALNNLLPILSMPRAPFRFPSYVATICRENPHDDIDRCSPILSPYGSFIFEDEVWYTND